VETSLPRHGWLQKNPEAPSALAGISFDGTFPTRREEYGFLHDELLKLPQGVALDAGCGYNPSIHVAAFVAAQLGWWVEAIDLDLRQFALPWHTRARRTCCSLAATPFPDRVFNVVYCISTLEHVNEVTRSGFVAEATRLLKPEGTLILTTDATEPAEVASWFKAYFEIGELEAEPEEQLEPKVSFLVAKLKDAAEWPVS
jgi:SAM-dependent methyltransferase